MIARLGSSAVTSSESRRWPKRNGAGRTQLFFGSVDEAALWRKEEAQGSALLRRCAAELWRLLGHSGARVSVKLAFSLRATLRGQKRGARARPTR